VKLKWLYSLLVIVRRSEARLIIGRVGFQDVGPFCGAATFSAFKAAVGLQQLAELTAADAQGLAETAMRMKKEMTAQNPMR
jgi:hypothetical protein